MSVTDFKVGRRVILQGLTTQPSLNGLKGHIINVCAERDRVGVLLESSRRRVSVPSASIRSAAMPTPPPNLTQLDRLEFMLRAMEDPTVDFVKEGIDAKEVTKILKAKLEELRANDGEAETNANYLSDAEKVILIQLGPLQAREQSAAWLSACAKIKESHGNKYPDDWWLLVVQGGLWPSGPLSDELSACSPGHERDEVAAYMQQQLCKTNMERRAAEMSLNKNNASE